MHVRALVTSLAHPSYTGAARRPGFVVANVMLLSVLSVVADAVVPVSGAVLVGVGLGLLTVRGYVVPGTPWVLGTLRDGLSTAPSRDRPPEERALRRAGVLAPADEGLRPTDSFVAAWRGRVRAAGPRGTDARSLATALELEPDAVTVSTVGGCLVAETGGRRLGVWPSRAALVADTATVAELRCRYPRWTRLSPRLQRAVFSTLRLTPRVCPTCDGSLTLERTLSRSPDVAGRVVAVTCTRCGAHLFESGVVTGVTAVDGSRP